MTVPTHISQAPATRPARLTPALLVLLVALFLVLTWPSYVLFSFAGLPNVSIPRLAMVVSTPLALLLLVRQYTAYRRAQVLFLIFGAYTIWRLLSDLLSEQPGPTLMLTILELVVFNSTLFLALPLSTLDGRRRWVARMIVLSTAITVALGMVELLAKVNIGAILVQYSSIDPRYATNIMMDSYRDGQLRVRSVFITPILFSQILGTLVPFLFVMATHREKSLFRLMALACLLLTPPLLLATGARSGLVVLAVSVVVFVGARSIRVSGRTVPLVAAVSIAALLLVPVLNDTLRELLQGRTTEEVSSSLAREQMIAKGMVAIAQNPVFGYGHGSSPVLAGIYDPTVGLSIDNNFLSTAIDFGVVGLLLQFALYSYMGILGLRAVATARDPFTRNLAAAGLAASMGLIVGQYIISTWEALLLVYLFTGLNVGIIADAKQSQARP